MGCSNTKPVTLQSSISFDSEYPSGESYDIFSHNDPSHDTEQLILHPMNNKLELIIDDPITQSLQFSSSSHQQEQQQHPSSSPPLSPLWNHPHSPSDDLTSPVYNRQQILLNPNHYVIESLLQEGAIGKVYIGRHKFTGQEYAFKFFGYTNINPEERDIEHEIQVMNRFRGISGIVQMIGYFYDTPQGLISGKLFCHPYPVIVMELLTGGEVFETIHHHSHITEYILSKIFYSMTLSVQSIHDKHYIHRDIKLENMMFTSPSASSAILASSTSFTSSGESLTRPSGFDTRETTVSGSVVSCIPEAATAIKIIDFGLMVKVTSPDAIYHDDDVVGTPGYLAPESLDYYDYSYASDIWSLGCCLYSMLSGLLPFNPNINQQDVHHRYRPMTGPAWVNISNEAKDLVKQLLQRSSQARSSIEQILSHPWLIDSAPEIPTSSPGGMATPAGVILPVVGIPSHRHEHLGEEYLSRIKYLSLKQKMKSFFMNSNQILDNNRRTRDQLQRIIPFLRRESSSLLSRSSSGSSLTMTPSPLSKRPSFLSNSTIASSMTHSPLKSTPPTLMGAHKNKSTPPGGGAGRGMGGQSSPYIRETFSALSKPPVRPHPQIPSFRNTPPHVGPKSPSLKSSHSLDILGRVSQQNSTTTSPVKPLRRMSENELQTRLQSFKRSVLSSLLRSTSIRSMSSNDIGGSVSQGICGNRHINGSNRCTINKETFLCLMLDAGLPELASSRVFNIFDTDHNGVLDLKEFLLTMLAFQSRSPRGGSSRRSLKQANSQRNRRKFYRSKQLRRSTLDNIEELKTDVSEVQSVPPRPVSTPSGSLVFQDIINAGEVSKSPVEHSSSGHEHQNQSTQGGLIGFEMNTLEEDLESDFPTSFSSPEKIPGSDENSVDEEDLLARLYFDIFDLDGNGSIDKDELRVAVNAFLLDEISTGTVGLTPTASSHQISGHRGAPAEIGGRKEGISPAFPFTQSDGDENSHNSTHTSPVSRNSPPIDQPSIQKTFLSNTKTESEQKMNQSQRSFYSSPAEATKDIEELFRTIDCNNTGKITFNEFLPFFKKIRRSGSDTTSDDESLVLNLSP